MQQTHKTTRTGIRINASDGEMRRLRKRLIDEGSSIAEFVGGAIRDYLAGRYQPATTGDAPKLNAE